MGVCGITFGEGGRRVLATFLAVANIVMAVAGFCIIMVGVYIKLMIDRFLVLLHEYDAGILPYMLIGVGAGMFVFGVAGVKICYDLGYVAKRAPYRGFLLPYVILIFLLTLVLLCASLAVRFHTLHVDKALHHGFEAAMKKYRKSLSFKTLIDQMQMGYSCCGSTGPTEWFEIAWVPTNYLDTESPAVRKYMKKGKAYLDSVPFSCCRADVHRPCIHHNLLQGKKHFRYKAGSHATIHKSGCAKKMITHFEDNLLIPLAAIIGILCCIQLVLTILTRFLQSSIISAFIQGDPGSDAPGFLFGSLHIKKLEESDEEESED